MADPCTPALNVSPSPAKYARPMLAVLLSIPFHWMIVLRSRIPIQLSETNAMSRAAVAGAKSSFDAEFSVIPAGPFEVVECPQKIAQVLLRAREKRNHMKLRLGHPVPTGMG